MKRLFLVLMTAFMSVLALAQETVQVKGTVFDENGWPVTGAYVLQQGTSNGTLTDLDGNFELSAPEGSLLEFTFMGYLTQTLPASSAAMTVTMEPDALMMEEVVVVGYGTQKSKDLTAPIVNIKGDELSKQIAKMGEEAKVSARMIRKNANDEIKQLKKDNMLTEDDEENAKKKVQDLTDKYIKQIDVITDKKVADIMAV